MASFLTLGCCPVECSGGVVTTRNHQNDRAEAAGYVMLSSSQEDVWSPQGVFSRVLAHFFRHRLRTDLIDDCHRSWFHEESRGLLRSSIKDALIVLVCVSCSPMQRVTLVSVVLIPTQGFRSSVSFGDRAAGGFRIGAKNKKTICGKIRGRQRSRFGGCGIVSVLGRVPAPPSRPFKDALDPSSQGGVGNCNEAASHLHFYVGIQTYCSDVRKIASFCFEFTGNPVRHVYFKTSWQCIFKR